MEKPCNEIIEIIYYKGKQKALGTPRAFVHFIFYFHTTSVFSISGTIVLS